MQIADLFINLGIKGADKTVGSLGQVEKGLKGVSSTAFEVKAALVGALYALEKIFSASGQKGTDLTNLGTQLNMTTKMIQQYEYAARQVGATNEEMDQTFLNIQSTMEKIKLGEGAPKWLTMMSNKLKMSLTDADIKNFIAHPDQFLQKFQEYSQLEQDKALKREVSQSLGIGDHIQQAANRNAFTPEVLDKAPVYSDNQVRNLDKSRAAWSNLMTDIEMGFGKLNAKSGAKIASDIEKLIRPMEKLVESVVKLGQALHVFDWFSKAIQGWTTILTGDVAILNTMSDLLSGDPKKEKSAKEKMSVFFNNAGEILHGAGISFMETEKNAYDASTEAIGGALATALETGHQGIRPSNLPNAEKTTSNNSAALEASHQGIRPSNLPNVEKAPSNNSTTVNQTNVFQHDGKDIHRTGADLKKATKDAVNQNSARVRVN